MERAANMFSVVETYNKAKRIIVFTDAQVRNFKKFQNNFYLAKYG